MKFPTQFFQISSFLRSPIPSTPRLKISATLPGGHVIYTVAESSWARIPLDDMTGLEAPPGQAGLTPEDPSIREEVRIAQLLTEFPVDGSHFFCDSLDLTRPFPSVHAPADAVPDYVWNAALAEPLRAAGLEGIPILMQASPGDPLALGEK